VNVNEQSQKEILNRLRRARGQLEGVISMIESGRSCRDVVTQLSAASRALDRAGYKLIAISMKECLVTDIDDRELTPDQLEQLFISLA
jgi:DNA-binding FrmR family transcriptional regulator